MSKVPHVPRANRSPHDPKGPDIQGKTPAEDHSTKAGQDANTRVNLTHPGLQQGRDADKSRDE